MHTTLLRISSALTTLALLGTASLLADNGAIWHNDVATAFSKAAQSDRYVLVDLYADWCGWCKKLEQEVFPTPTFQAKARELILLKVDTEDGGEGEALKLRYKVSTLPTTLILDAEQALVGTMVGYADAETIVAAIDERIAEWEALGARWSNLTAESDPAEVQSIALEYHQRNDGKRAAELYSQLLEKVAENQHSDRAWLLYREADSRRIAGQYPRAAALVQQAEAASSKVDEPEIRQRIALLHTRIDHDRGDCAGAILGLERFLEKHPNSELRSYATTTLYALQSGDTQCS